MLYNFYFDICALCILFAIIGITLFRTWVPTYRNRMFMFLLLTVLGTTLAERWETLLQLAGPQGRAWYHAAEMLCGSLYFLLHLLSAVAYLIYILALLNIHVSPASQLRRVFLPALIGAGCVAVNLFYPVLFSYDGQGIYHRGPFIWVYYLLAAHYIFSGLLHLQRGRRIIRRQTRIIMEVFVGFALCGLLVQFLWPEQLVEEFVYALALALTFFTIQSPAEMIDAELRILNRKAYLTGIQADVVRDSEDASIFLCVDHIESIGEQIGRAQVVALLRMIAAYLRGFGKYGYLCRYSPQVFVLALRDEDPATQARIMQQISGRFREPWDFGGMQVRVECCVFALRRPEHFREVGELMRTVSVLADPRMHAGRQILEVSEVDLDHSMDTRRIAALLRESIDAGRAQVYYQAVHVSGEHRIAGYDACLMLPDGESGGIVRGGVLSDSAENGATLADADEYVLRRVCRFLRTNREAGEPCPMISVRLSWSEIARPDFKEQMQDILRIEGVSFSLLCFKLRETTLSALTTREEDAINWLVARGAAVIIDGFGMGYADIARLRRIHVSCIVLDHSLLEAAAASAEFLSLVRGIVDMLHDIRISVIIDEVASRREASLAADLGCDYLQGDFLGEPQAERVRLSTAFAGGM